MPRHTRVLTDPALIRRVLADADATCDAHAARKHGLHPATVNGWRRRRADEHPDWPDQEYIDDWHRWRAEKAEEHRKGMAYRSRRYLNGGEPLNPSSVVTCRKIQALFALGWTFVEIGEQLGVRKDRVWQLATARTATVTPETVAAVDRVYRAMHMKTPPPHVAGRNIDYRARGRRWAARKGFAPPLAWDDIDNPDEKPPPRSRVVVGSPKRRPADDVDPVMVKRVLDGQTVAGTTQAERRIIMQTHLERGGTERELCTRMGWRAGRYLPADAADYQAAS